MDTIDIDTQITTAARRITRAVNAHGRDVTLFFDAEGREVGSRPSGMWFTGKVPEWVASAAVQCGGTRGAQWRMTEREAQDRLDAFAATGFSDVSMVSGFLQDLEMARARRAM